MKMSTRRAVRRPRPGSPGPMARRRHRAGPLRFLSSRAWFVGALVLLLRRSAWEGGVAAQQDNDDGSTSAPAALYPDCEADMALVGDSLCDLDFNVAECGFDGGDCCECTCVDTGDQVCGEGGGYFCVDPDAPQDCASAPSPTPGTPSSPTSSDAIGVTAGPTSLDASDDPYPGCGGYIPHIGDGYCDEDNNTAACGFDGGDCCACTCGVDSEVDHECGLLGDGYDCRDPDVPDDCNLANFAQCEGMNGYDWQDGYCDDDLNTAECGYDGGDCCRCTCRDYDSWGYYSSCGYYGYDCLDPEAPSSCSTDSPTPSPAAGTEWPECEGYHFAIGDGYCDYYNNNEECDWDGGDCCACTCVSGSYTCGLYTFDCEDPSVSTDCSTTSTLDSDDWYGGYGYYTDDIWDSGDDFYGTDDFFDYGSTTCTSSLTSDGWCDSYNNHADCEWDGGDCCECDCVDATYECGVVGYDCLDPTSSCSDSPGTPSPSLLDSEARDAESTSTSTSSSSVATWQIVAGFSGAMLAFCCFSGIVYSACLRCRGKLGDAKDEQGSGGGVGGGAAASATVATSGTQPAEPEGPAAAAAAATPAAK